MSQPGDLPVPGGGVGVGDVGQDGVDILTDEFTFFQICEQVESIIRRQDVVLTAIINDSRVRD